MFVNVWSWIVRVVVFKFDWIENRWRVIKKCWRVVKKCWREG